MSQDQDYDPFADFGDLDEFDTQDGSEGFDELGDVDMSSDADHSFDGGDGNDGISDGGEFESPADAAAPQSGDASPSGNGSADSPKPFLKTPIGMASIGLGVLAVAGIGIGVSGILSSGEQQYVAPYQEPAPVQPIAEPVYADPMQALPNQNLSPLQAQISADSPEPTAPVVDPVFAQAPAPMVAQVSFDPTELLEEMKNQREDLKALKGSLDSLGREVRSLSSTINAISKENEQIRGTLTDITNKLDQAELAPSAVKNEAEEVSAEKTDAKADEADEAAKAHPAVEGRDRIADFSVIDVSSSGEMVIIKKDSNGRVFTVFKGEILNISGKRLPVTAIEDDGNIILVGQNLFIDRVLEKRVVRPSRPAPRPAPRPSEPVVAEGMTLNAVYDQNRSFGVMVKGEYQTWNVGQSIPHLGGAKVTGLDNNGNLKVGNHIIKSVY